MEVKPRRDSLSYALDAVADRWALHVVRALALGAERFTDVLHATGSPRDVLTVRLRRLVDEGMVRRTSTADGDAWTGYALTPKGRELAQVLLVLKRWGDAYRPEGTNASPSLRHSVCGHVFQAEIHCSACHLSIRPGEVQLD